MYEERMSEAISFGAWLRDRREALDLTREDLAREIGISWSAIKKIEIGQRRPSKQVAELLAEYLHIPSSERASFIRFAREEPQATNGPTPIDVSGQEESRPEDTPPAQSVSAGLPTNLPTVLTPLVGREYFVSAVCAYLQQVGIRLLTITGPPGVGKTRLAAEAAARLAGLFPGGVFFVPLDSVREPDLLVASIVQVLGLKDANGETAAGTVTEALKDRTALLVLDNFEQVVDAAPLVVEMLAACPGLKVLATSLSPLHVRGEQQVALPPLDLPNIDHLPPLSYLASCSAIRLFVERAKAVRADFALTEENAEAVAAICARLDGLPLAIELVAARIKLLPPQALLDRLLGAYGDTPLHMLAGGPRDLPARHRALAEAIGWSYNLLPAEEQKLFARLAVFAGGCTLPAVQAVCNALGDLALDVLDGVQSLVDKSLLGQMRSTELGTWSETETHSQVRSSHSEEPRFAMLATIREYALQRLEASGEGEAVHAWHAEYFQALAEAAASHLSGAEQKAWIDRLARDHENIRTALRWALDTAQVETAARLAGSVWRFWAIRGYYGEGRHWLEQILARGASLPAMLRAQVLHGAGVLADNQDDYDRARELFEESLAIRRDMGDRQNVAYLLNNLGNVAYHVRDYARAQELFEASLEIKQALNDEPSIASSLNNLGIVAHDRGEYARAAALFEECLARARAVGDAHGTALSLNNLGDELRRQGDYQRAASLHEEARALAGELGDRMELATALNGLASVARSRGDYARAREFYAMALTLRHELGDTRNTTATLRAVAALLALEKQWEGAYLLFGAAEKGGGPASSVLTPAERDEYEPLIEDARLHLGQAAAEATRGEGRALSTDQAVEQALAALQG